MSYITTCVASLSLVQQSFLTITNSGIAFSRISRFFRLTTHTNYCKRSIRLGRLNLPITSLLIGNPSEVSGSGCLLRTRLNQQRKIENAAGDDTKRGNND